MAEENETEPTDTEAPAKWWEERYSAIPSRLRGLDQNDVFELLQDFEEHEAGLAERVESAEAELADARRTADEARATVEAAAVELRRAEEEKSALEARVGAASTESAAARQEIAQLRARVAELDGEIARLQARIATLSDSSTLADERLREIAEQAELVRAETMRRARGVLEEAERRSHQILMEATARARSSDEDTERRAREAHARLDAELAQRRDDIESMIAALEESVDARRSAARQIVAALRDGANRLVETFEDRDLLTNLGLVLPVSAVDGRLSIDTTRAEVLPAPASDPAPEPSPAGDDIVARLLEQGRTALRDVLSDEGWDLDAAPSTPASAPSGGVESAPGVDDVSLDDLFAGLPATTAPAPDYSDPFTRTETAPPAAEYVAPVATTPAPWEAPIEYVAPASPPPASVTPLPPSDLWPVIDDAAPERPAAPQAVEAPQAPTPVGFSPESERAAGEGEIDPAQLLAMPARLIVAPDSEGTADEDEPRGSASTIEMPSWLQPTTREAGIAPSDDAPDDEGGMLARLRLGRRHAASEDERRPDATEEDEPAASADGRGLTSSELDDASRSFAEFTREW